MEYSEIIDVSLIVPKKNYLVQTSWREYWADYLRASPDPHHVTIGNFIPDGSGKMRLTNIQSDEIIIHYFGETDVDTKEEFEAKIKVFAKAMKEQQNQELPGVDAGMFG